MSEPGLQADVSLDIQAAIAQVDALEAVLSAAVTSVEVTVDTGSVTDVVSAAVADANTDVTVLADADISEAQSALDAFAEEAQAAGADVPITADTSAAEAAIEAVAADADATQADITIGADTSAAQEEIDSLGESSAAASSSVGDLAGNLQGVSGVSQSAAGGAAAAGAAIGKISPATAGAVAGITALVGVTKTFLDRGLGAEESIRRLDTVAGVFAANVRQVDVGSLNDDLAHLAGSLGTSTSALRNTAARIFQLGTSAGVAGPQVAKTTDQILALALNARALNPALGQAGDIALGLSNGLARGGRFLSQFGISLTAAQINAEALAETGKTTAAELSVYEKSAAGAKLATDQLGASFAGNIALASDNPAIRLDILSNNFKKLQTSIGLTLIEPVVGAMEELEPAAEDAAHAIGSIIEAITPLLPILGVGAKAVSLAAKAFELSLKPLELATEGIGKLFGLFHHDSGAKKLAADVKEATQAMADQDGVVRLAADAVGRYVEASSRFKDQNQIDDLKRVGLSLADVGRLALDGADGLEKLRHAAEAAGESKNNTGDLVHSLKDVQEVLDGVAEDQIRDAKTAGAISKAQRDAALATDDHVAALKRLQPAIDQHAKDVATVTALYGPLIASTTSGINAFELVTGESAKAGAAIKSLGTDGVQPTDAALLTFATALKDAGLSSQGMDAAAASLGITTQALTGFLDGATGALDDFIKSAVDGLPTVGDVLSEAFSADHVVGISDFIAGLNKSTAQTEQFLADIDAIVQAGGQDIAAELVKQGVEAGGGYARSLAASIFPGGVSPLVSETEKAVDAHNAEIERATDYLTDTFGPRYIAQTGVISNLASEAFNGNLSFADKIRLQAGLAETTLDDQGKAIAIIAANQGAAAAEAYGRLLQIDRVTVEAGIRAQQAILGSRLPEAVGLVGDAAKAAFGGPISKIPLLAGLGVQGAEGAAHAARPALVSEMTNIGIASLQGIGQSLAKLPILAGLALDQTAAVVNSKAPSFFGKAKAIAGASPSAGKAAAAANTKAIDDLLQTTATKGVQTAGAIFPDVGKAAAAGVADGIKEVTPEVAQRAAGAVTAAFNAAADAAHRTTGLVTDPAQQAMLGFARSIDSANLSAAEFEQVAKAMGVSADQLRQFIDGATGAVDDFAESVISKFDSVSDAFSDATAKAKKLQDDFVPFERDGFIFVEPDPVDPVGGLIESLNDSADKTQTFIDNVERIFNAGGKDIAAALAQQGADAGGAYAQELVDALNNGDQHLLDVAEATIDHHNAVMRALADEVRNNFAPAFVESTQKILDVERQSGVSGSQAGQAFADGLAVGISSHRTNVENAAAQIVRDAEAAARAEAKSHSPSELFADLGRDLADGLAVGVDDGGADVVLRAEEIVREAFAAAQAAASEAPDISLGFVSGFDPRRLTVAPGAAALAGGGAAGSISFVLQFGDVTLGAGVTQADFDRFGATVRDAVEGIDAVRLRQAVTSAVRMQGQTA